MASSRATQTQNKKTNRDAKDDHFPSNASAVFHAPKFGRQKLVLIMLLLST